MLKKRKIRTREHCSTVVPTCSTSACLSQCRCRSCCVKMWVVLRRAWSENHLA